MRIVDVPVTELQRVRRRGRARSSETLQLIDAIEALKPGQARAIELGQGEDPTKIRAKLAYASKIAGKRLRVVVADHRVLFARGPGRPRKRAE